MEFEKEQKAAKKAKSFVLYSELGDTIELLDMTERGELITLIFNYVNTGSTALGSCAPKVEIIFSLIRKQLDRDLEKYEKVCKRNAENGKKGGRPKKTDADKKACENSTSSVDDEEENNPEKPKKAYNNNNNKNKNNNENNNDNINYYNNNPKRQSTESAESQNRSFRPYEKNKKENKKIYDVEPTFDTDDFFEAALRHAYSEMEICAEKENDAASQSTDC